jgi:hypothetical protein
VRETVGSKEQDHVGSLRSFFCLSRAFRVVIFFQLKNLPSQPPPPTEKHFFCGIFYYSLRFIFFCFPARISFYLFFCRDILFNTK